MKLIIPGRIEAMDAPGKLVETYQVESMADVFVKLARKAKRGE